ncbi:MAG: PaaI family thioesterase [Sterolibacterium sp.]|jgi:acyl-coenzyme A thioesterase PaaI-like protein|nr:PaaI family thioesterase [Sterolibacterium sp.]
MSPHKKADSYRQSDSSVTVAFPEPTGSTEMQHEKRRAGAALRRIIDGIIMKHPEVSTLSTCAEQLEAIAATLEAMPDKPARTSFGHRMKPEDVRDFLEFSPLVGHANPIAPPLEIWVANGRAHGRVSFGRCFEGAPGVVHGGYVAAVFDELLGFVQGFAEQPGMTGTLTITYRAPTPLLTELKLEGVLEGTEGRKIHTVGRIFSGETLLAEARGVFITLTENQYAMVAAMQSEP